MRAAVFHGPGKLELTDVPDPVAGPGEVVLDVLANTVCGTDVRLLSGQKAAKPGTILGHEISGRVAEVGEGVDGYAVGDTVVVVPSVTCGNCWFCNRDLEQFCEHYRLYGYEVHGGLAERVHIDAAHVTRGNLIHVTPDLAVGAACLAEPLSCVLNGFREYGVTLGDTVTILGAGPIGLLHTQLATLAGARNILVSDPSASRRAQAERLGATRTVDPTADDVPAVARELTGGRGSDVVVIAIGRAELMDLALKTARIGGRVNAFAGFPKGGSATIDPNDIHYGQLTVTGGSNSRRSDFAEAVALMSGRQVDVESMVSHRFDLEDVVEAIEFSSSGEGVKVAVVPNLNA